MQKFLQELKPLLERIKTNSDEINKQMLVVDDSVCNIRRLKADIDKDFTRFLIEAIKRQE